MFEGSDPAPKGCFARHEFERLAALEAIADTIRLRRDLPGIFEELLAPPHR